MIDTLESASSALETESSPGSVTLKNISFDDGKLWQPRYPTLFNYTVTALLGLDLVPSFRMRDNSVNVILELESSFKFRYTPDPDPKPFRVIQGEATIGFEVTSKVTPDNKTLETCVLAITPGTPLVVLQVLCENTNQPISNRDEIEGGLFLSIVKDSRSNAMLILKNDPPSLDTGMIHLTGRDGHERLKYSIFTDEAYSEPLISPGLEPEPAFRIRNGNTLNASISLVLTDLLFSKAANPEEISLQMREPSDKPGGLSVPFLKYGNNVAREDAGSIRWYRPDPSVSAPKNTPYQAISFCMDIHQMTHAAKEILARSLTEDPDFRSQLFGEKERDGQFGRKLQDRLSAALAEDPKFFSKLPVVGRVDPTIIDTPTCTEINGRLVCSG